MQVHFRHNMPGNQKECITFLQCPSGATEYLAVYKPIPAKPQTQQSLDLFNAYFYTLIGSQNKNKILSSSISSTHKQISSIRQ